MYSEDDRLYEEASGVFAFLHDPEIQKQLVPLLLDIIDNALAVVSQFCPAIEPIRNLLHMFRPDLKHEEIMNAFDDLRFRLEDLKYDRLKSKREEAWQHTKTRVIGAIRDVENCARVVRILRDGVPQAGLDEWRHELALAGRPVNAALMHLFKSMSPVEKDKPLNDNLFQCYYEYVGGDRRMVESMVWTSLQLLANGLTAFCVYKAQRHTTAIIADMFERYQFRQRFLDAANSAGQSLAKCLTEYPANMTRDIKDVFYKNRTSSPKSKLLELSELFDRKYYWLETFCVLYLPSAKSDRDVEFESSSDARVEGTDVVDARTTPSGLDTDKSLLVVDLSHGAPTRSKTKTAYDTDETAATIATSPRQHSTLQRHQTPTTPCTNDRSDRASPTKRKKYETSDPQITDTPSNIDDNNNAGDITKKEDKDDGEDQLDSSVNLSEISRSKCVVFTREAASTTADNAVDSKNGVAILKKFDRLLYNIPLFAGVKKIKESIRLALQRENIAFWGLAVFKRRNTMGFKVASVYRTSLNDIDKLVWVENGKFLICVLLK